MTFFFKYMAVRVWSGVFFGALAALAVLPLITDTIGLAWVVIPGLALCVAAFWLTDRVFAVIGRFQFGRLMREVIGWERAGMDREARQVLARAESVANSFLFSPASRKRAMGRLMARIVRLELAGNLPDAVSENFVGHYLRQFPQDRDAAARWLEGILSSSATSPQIHDIAVRIGAAHTGDMAIQQLLAQFYLADRRCDFDALHTYQILMDGRTPVPEKLAGSIAELFLSARRVDPLALQAYLAAYQAADQDVRLLSGIAACRREIRATSLTQPFLEKADGILAALSPAQGQDLAEHFLPDRTPDAADDGKIPLPCSKGSRLAALGAWMRRIREGWRRRWNASAVFFQPSEVETSAVMRRVRRAVLVVAGLSISVLTVSTILHLKTDPRRVELPPPPAAPPVAELQLEVIAPPVVTDPFSLQAAAFLKEADARKTVEKLKNRGIDAYWIWTVSGGKTWYQVRISHFKTKDEARAYGDELKQQQLISDYYVTNYKAPETP